MTDAYREPDVEDRSILVVAFHRHVFGVHPSNGRIAWKHTMGANGSAIEIQIRYGRVFASNGLELHCLEYPSGRPIGKVPVPDKYKGRATMVIDSERIFLASQGEVTCFSLDGTLLWMQGFQGAGTGGVALGLPGNLRQADNARG